MGGAAAASFAVAEHMVEGIVFTDPRDIFAGLRP